MPRHTKLINKKLYIVTFLLFIFYAFTTLMVGYYTYDSYTKYGVYYSEITMTQFTSDLFMNISIAVVMLITTTILYLSANQNVMVLDYDPKSQDTGSYGIEFPNGRPEKWDISANIETQCLEITLDGNLVTISKQTVENLFKGTVKKIE